MTTSSTATRPAPTEPSGPAPHVDVLVVGAGLSGIGAACHLQTEARGTSYAILEARAASGGTWDLFRFPGIRSDSDMFTLGYSFRPWRGAESIVQGEEILRYVRDTARAYGVDHKIEYHSRVVEASWSSEAARWTVTVEHTESGERTERTCGFLYLCPGYYRYEEGYTPQWPGREQFQGEVVHPQHWPEDLQVSGKKVVVVGSGATAVTVVPALADLGAHVTMLQRSPSFVMSMPTHDAVADLLRRVLPERRAYSAIRWKNAKVATALYSLCQRYPKQARSLLTKGVVKALPEGFDVDTHFAPAYNPWDQRMCLVPDGDFFASIRDGKVDLVTDHIESFTATGLRLRSGDELEADIVVTATGLDLLLMGGIDVSVDGEPVVLQEHVVYKGMMLDGVPNLAFAIGYTNAPWTLKVDLVSSQVARTVHHMRRNGFDVVTPHLPAGAMDTTPLIEMSSGYFTRARHGLPLQGDKAPWRIQQNFFKDAPLYHGPVDEEHLRFERVAAASGAAR